MCHLPELQERKGRKRIQKDKVEGNVQIKKYSEYKSQEALGRNKIALLLLPCATEQRVSP